MKGYSYPFICYFFPRARHLFYDSFFGGGKEERIFYYRLVSLAIVLRHTVCQKELRHIPEENHRISYIY